MIHDINGNPYTSADDDLSIMRVREALSQVIHEEVQRSIACAVGAEAQIDARKIFPYYEIVYALGRARGGCLSAPTPTERGRFETILAEVLERLAAQVQTALEHTHEGRADLVLAPVLELLMQAYYAGREDGAA